MHIQDTLYPRLRWTRHSDVAEAGIVEFEVAIEDRVALWQFASGRRPRCGKMQEASENRTRSQYGDSRPKE